MTAGEWGYTVPPEEGGSEIAVALAEAAEEERHHERLPPARWIRQRLFSTWYNGVITVVLGAIVIVVAYRLARFVFVTGQWEAVEQNLELFMIGQFPRDERWRIVAQFVVLGAAIGLALGNIRAMARDRARESGVPLRHEGWTTYARSYWAAVLLVVVLLVAFTDGIEPWLVALASVVAAVAAWFLAAVLPRRLRALGWTLAALAAVVQFQLLSGTDGLAWVFSTLALAPVATSEVKRFVERHGLTPRLRGHATTIANLAVIVVLAVVVRVVYDRIGLEGVDWSDWGGFHLNLVATVVAIVVAFPLGVVLALGRRSKLPAIKAMSIAYIEFFRGVPLITLLLAANFFLGFFLDTDTPLSLITRGIAAITLFSGAYIAEVVRGGLQAVPHGQVEAGLAAGLPTLAVTRLVVMPQALRAVIPAMVGQFISLFKDTSLFSIIAVNELLNMREVVHAQEAFRSIARAETLLFVAFGFWAIAFTMSRESQRLERRLGVGER